MGSLELRSEHLSHNLGFRNGFPKIKAANFNSRALNALFNAITNEEFKKISFTETAKEA